MTAQHTAVDVLVNTRLVVDKIFVDREGSLSGSVGHQLFHDVSLLMLNIMGLQPVSVVLVVLFRVFCVFTVAMALGCGSSFLTWLSGSVDVMFTRLDVVGLTANVGTVFAPRHKSLFLPELPGVVGKSTIATKAAAVAAGQQVFWTH